MERDRQHILIVDDQRELRRMLSRAVQATFADCRVLEAPDGLVATRILDAVRPSVVVLDLRMPGMDGFELCRWIRTRRITRSTEVIAMSGTAAPDDVMRILGYGARAFLPKPVEMSRLHQEIRDVLQPAGTAAIGQP